MVSFLKYGVWVVGVFRGCIDFEELFRVGLRFSSISWSGGGFERRVECVFMRVRRVVGFIYIVLFGGYL